MISKSKIISTFVFESTKIYITIENPLFKELNKILEIENNNNKNIFLFIDYIIEKLIIKIRNIIKSKSKFIYKN